jgi:hypothetical protein
MGDENERGGAGFTRLPLKSPLSPAGLTGCPADFEFLVYLLLGGCFHHRYDGDVGAAFGFSGELNFAVDKREQGMVFAHADVTAGMPHGAALTSDDVAGDGQLATRLLQAEAAAFRVAAVAG